MNFTIYRSFSSINNLKNIWMILYIVFDLLNWRECCQYFPFVRNRIIFTIFSKFQQTFSHFFIKKCFTLFSTFTWLTLIKMRAMMTIISPIFFLRNHNQGFLTLQVRHYTLKSGRVYLKKDKRAYLVHNDSILPLFIRI